MTTASEFADWLRTLGCRSSVHVAVGKALVSTLRMLDEHGLARIERNDRGQIARVRRSRRGRA